MKNLCLFLAFPLLFSCTSAPENKPENDRVLAAKTIVKTEAPKPEEPIKILETEGEENAYPRWSEDGSQVLFQSNKGGKWQLYSMQKDGSNIRQLTSGNHNNNYPDWSADNAKIAFVSDRNGNEEVYIMNADGSNLQNITNNPARDIHPYFSPDGKTLLFNSSRDNENSFEIYQVALNGKDLKRLTNTPEFVETCARFSPDGKKIVYLRGHVTEATDDVYLCKADGSEVENITKSNGSEGWPVWSADGTKIIYSNDDSGTFCLYEIDLKTKQKKQLTFAEYPVQDARASISPANSLIMLNRKKGATIGIYTLPINKAQASN